VEEEEIQNLKKKKKGLVREKTVEGGGLKEVETGELTEKKRAINFPSMEQKSSTIHANLIIAAKGYEGRGGRFLSNSDDFTLRGGGKVFVGSFTILGGNKETGLFEREEYRSEKGLHPSMRGSRSCQKINLSVQKLEDELADQGKPPDTGKALESSHRLMYFDMERKKENAHTLSMGGSPGKAQD